MADIERSGVDLDGLSNFLDSLSSYHEFLVQIPSPDQQIFHYTDLAALSGIVSGHDLWLTNSLYSNDEDESRHGYEVARGVVAAYLRRAKRARAARDDLKIAYAEALSSLIGANPSQGFYICCFCETDNLLSQWRSYGANGTGVSIAFDPMAFIDISGPDMPHGLMRLWKVFYNQSQQTRIVGRALDFVWDTRTDAEGADDLARRAADAVQFFIPTFKNADFREEKERRLIFTPDPACPVKPRYRVGRGMLIPYFSVRDLAEASGLSGPDMPWRLPIRSLTVGPSAQKQLNVESAVMLLHQNGYDGIEVGASATPYRG